MSSEASLGLKIGVTDKMARLHGCAQLAKFCRVQTPSGLLRDSSPRTSDEGGRWRKRGEEDPVFV